MASFQLEDVNVLFERAARYVQLNTHKFNAEKLLELYSYFKQVTNGPCSERPTNRFDFRSKKKFDAWIRLGNMSRDDAMTHYIQIVAEVDPKWNDTVGAKFCGSAGLGVAVSCMASVEEPLNDRDKTLFDWVKERNLNKLSRNLTAKNVNTPDATGMNLLHWAADRGYDDVVILLIERGADLNCQDQEGQTPLHYAVSCGHNEIVSLLVQKKARQDIPDNQGQVPRDLAQEKEVQNALDQI